MTKTTINKAIDAAQHPILLQTAAQLESAEQAWGEREILGIDTEFVRERTYRADLGLVQVSDGETAWLVDPLIEASRESLAALLHNPAISKVLHSSSEDLEVLLHSLGALPEPLFDTQIACAMLGQPLQMGYHNACEWLFEVAIDKDQTRSNWCKRPLTERQLHYAAMDVVLLPEMLVRLRRDLEEAGRMDWLREDVARMQRQAARNTDPDLAYLRIAGANRLDDENLRVLRSLARWRENTAREKNRARGFVIPDISLMQITKRNPRTVEGMRGIEGLHPRAAERYARILWKIMEETRSDTSRIERLQPLNDSERRVLNQMRKLVKSKAEELSIEPALLASRRELERLIRSRASGDAIPERFSGWRKSIITDDLLSVF